MIGIIVSLGHAQLQAVWSHRSPAFWQTTHSERSIAFERWAIKKKLAVEFLKNNSCYTQCSLQLPRQTFTRQPKWINVLMAASSVVKHAPWCVTAAADKIVTYRYRSTQNVVSPVCCKFNRETPPMTIAASQQSLLIVTVIGSQLTMSMVGDWCVLRLMKTRADFDQSKLAFSTWMLAEFCCCCW
jgi:hypothetical protein